MRNLYNLRAGAVRFHHHHSCGVMHDDRAGCLRNPPQHGIPEVFRVRARCGTSMPEIRRLVPSPFAVVVNEFVDILLFGQGSEKEVLQHGVMQNHHPGPGERPRVDVSMKLIVP